jgi:hypothetical protein
MATEQRVKVFRLALREEGDFVNAYLASPDGMEGAILIGTLRLSIAQIPPAFADFYRLMAAGISAITEVVTGEAPELREENPPAHEIAPKGGH